MSNWRRRLAMGSNSILATTFLLALLGFVYAFASNNRIQHDFSEDGSNTLQPDTLAKLELLESDGIPVTISAFTSQAGKPFSSLKNRKIRDLLTRMSQHSSLIDWRVIDFDRERLSAENLGVREYGTVVIQRGNARIDIKERQFFHRTGKGIDAKLMFNGEDRISAAFSQLRNDKPKVIYFLTQHGEKAHSSSKPDGISKLSSKMLLDRFESKPLNLMATRNGKAPEIPTDASAIVIAGPKSPLSDSETDLILSFLDAGGSLFIAVDPDSPEVTLLERIGVRRMGGFAVDLVTDAWGRPITLLNKHNITNQLIDNQLSVVLAYPAGLQFKQSKGLKIKSLMQLSRKGWIELGTDSNTENAVFDPDVDKKEAASLMAAIEMSAPNSKDKSKMSRVVVSGDIRWFQNDMLKGGNEALAVNVMRWLSENDDMLEVSVERHDTLRRLVVPKPELGWLRAMSLFPIPLFTLFIGMLVWWGRRGR